MDIVTLTLNPCVDRTEWVKDFGREPDRVEFQSGGKGINMARVLAALGASCAAVAPYGGADGERFALLARSEGVNLTGIAIQGNTRTVLTQVRLCDMAQSVRFGAPPEMTEDEAQALYRAVDALLPGAKLLVVGGSACSAHAAQAGKRLIARAKALHVKTLLDASGLMLDLGAEALPDMIKPNQQELAQLAGRDIPAGMEEQAAGELIARGIKRVLVSLGEAGAALFTESGAIYCPAPRVHAVNAVGSGDSFVAGYIYASLKGANEYAALSYACAAGAANARVFPAARVTKREIEEISGFGL